MFKKFLSLGLVIMAATAGAEELVIAENGKCDYQIVIPDKAADEVVDQWLLATAKLMQAAFDRNGFKIEVVKESAKAADMPGIYLGATGFAGKHGIQTDEYNDWTYSQKVVGKDLIIAGNDRKDPVKTTRGTNIPLALLGTVKGACDFLRQHVGVRFLFINMQQGPGELAADGSLKLDARSIAFLPAKRIAVPADLDLKKTPMLRACAENSNYETFYYIANNFFPLLSSVQGSEVHWGDVISRAEYGASHPEYFALMPDGKRSIEHAVSSTGQGEEKHCVTQPGVVDLMVRELVKRVEAGEQTIMIMPPDSFRLCYCNCDGCNRLFGAQAKSDDDIRARARSGKLWQSYFAIAKGVQKKHPEARLVIWDYQDTPIATVREVPENVIPKLNMGKQADLNKFDGVRTPAGVCALEETFTGFGVGGRYLPERTPEYIAGMVQAMARYKVQWTTRDGSLGYVRGLQGPAYYVYGRMLDDPSADWRGHFEEFCTAAFGEVAPVMTQFYDQLNEQIALYSDFFGVNAPAWNRKYGRSTYRGNKWHVVSMYPPEYCAAANALLASAESGAKDPDVKARLHLLRIEFDYPRGLARMFHLHSAWLLNPSPEFLNPLVDSIEAWHALVRSTAEKPLDDWPEVKPYYGHSYNHAALRGRSYQQLWDVTCVNWDTAAIRGGILDDPHRLAVPLVESEPGPDDSAWEKAPAQVLRVLNDMPLVPVRTTLKVLRDRNCLYVRLDCLNPGEHPEDIPAAKAEGDVFKQEHVELAIRPAADGRMYRLAANPTSGARYDALWTPDAKNAEDTAWNGRWEFAFRTTGKKGPWSLSGRIWTAWFKIPFSDLGAAAPAAGEAWGFNADRVRINPGIFPQHILWRNAPALTDPQSLGTLVF